MTSIPIYATPLPPRQTRPPHSLASSQLKRKRDALQRGQDAKPINIEQEGHTSHVRSSIDYMAIVTPMERSQRRLAGLPLDQDLPQSPFPHAADLTLDTFHKAQSKRAAGIDEAGLPINRTASLHRQHMSATMAMLHQSMVELQYDRALRVMGLILRNRFGGHTVDIRSEGLWGIGAEILLRLSRSNSTNLKSSSLSQEGFQRTQAFFETLSVQYPQQKTWPDVVNAVDFCAALFNLWIFIVQEEKRQMEMEEHSDESYGSVGHIQQAITWELAHAKRIAQTLDSRMQDVLLREQPILMQLRRMVALWTADLCAAAAALELDSDSNPGDRYLWDGQHTDVATTASVSARDTFQAGSSPASVQLRLEEAECRRLAKNIAAKLQHHVTSDEHSSTGD